MIRMVSAIEWSGELCLTKIMLVKACSKTFVSSQNRRSVLHINVEKINKLLVCPQMIVSWRYKNYVKNDYLTDINVI